MEWTTTAYGKFKWTIKGIAYCLEERGVSTTRMVKGDMVDTKRNE